MAALWMKRIAKDIKELKTNGHEIFRDESMVALGENDELKTFVLVLKSPDEGYYKGFAWRIRFEIPNEYPFKSPSVGFVKDKIFHPNVDEASGTICLDVLNKNWSPACTIRHLIEDILPLFLISPNPNDPLNGDASVLLKNSPTNFEKKVQEHSKKFAFKSL
jgi:ubiquitin-conjugating enzyme E2 H